MAHPSKQGTSFPAAPPVQSAVKDEPTYFNSSDDEFWDNLRPEEIKSAEIQALARHSQWQATQATQATQRHARQPSPNYIADDDDDEVTEVAPPVPVIERLPPRVVQQVSQPQDQQPYRPQAVVGRVLNQPSRYPATGAVVPTPSHNNPQYKRPVPLFSSTNGGWTPSQQFAAPNRQIQYPPSSQNQTSSRPNTQQGYTSAPVSRPTTAGSDENDVESLKKQLEELRQEKEALNSKLLAKSGEVSLVRSNAERSAKEHEAVLTALRLQAQEQAAKQQKAIEDAKKAEQARASELEFTKRDLADEARKLREAQRTKSLTVPRKDGGLGTPTKVRQRETSFRDGFEDEEMGSVSPSKVKSGRPAKESPGKRKRKRRPGDEPARALEVELEPVRLVENPAEKELEMLREQVVRLRVSDERLEFLETILDHKYDNKHLKSMEEFAQFAFPHTPSVSFTSIILDRLPAITQNHHTALATEDPFSAEVVNMFVDLWSECKMKNYFEPLPLLIDIITYALELRTSEIAPHVLSHLLPIAQETALLIANPLFRHKPPPSFAQHIDVMKILDLLHLVLVGCLAADTGEPAHFATGTNNGYGFWENIRIEFVLTMLSLRQPMQQFGMVCRMLSLSVRQFSPHAADWKQGGFGPVQEEGEEDVSAGLLERMSYLLTEIPASLQVKKTGSTGKHKDAGKGKAKNSKELARLRLQILTTLRDFSMVQKGARHIVEHAMVIARVATCLSSTLDSLYGYQSHHRVLAAIVNMSVSLLHYLVFAFPDLDIRQKLSVVQGGFARYQLTMARVNAAERRRPGSEDWDSQEAMGEDEEDDKQRNVLLGGVKEETMDRAQKLLEECVTMEEGEEIEAVFPFGTPR